MVRQGGEFLINEYTTDSQLGQAIAVDSDGDFVVTWTDAGQDSNQGVFAARFDSTGAAVNSEFQVNAYTENDQKGSAVASESNGDFVIVWQSFAQDSSLEGVFGRRYTSAGASLATEFRVNTYFFSSQRFARVDSDADGDFVVVWESFGQDRSGVGIFGKRFNSVGVPYAEFQVPKYATRDQRHPAVALDSTGDFVVVWEGSYYYYGLESGVFAQRFSSAGLRQGPQFRVNAYTTNSQSYPRVTAAANGDFVVAWQNLHQDGDSFGIFARRFSSSGFARGSEFQVNLHTTGSQSVASIAADDSGDFVVTWVSRQQDGDDMGVFARRFTASGTAIGGEFQVNSYTFGAQGTGHLNWDSDGDFVIGWTSYGQDGDLNGVFAQRFSLLQLATLDVDGNGEIEALTDGLLVLRDHFGSTGATLVTGAVGPDCTRCAASAITNYLTDLGFVLDIDNNGFLDALTDGVLVLRFTFGFTGAALVQGAVAGNCVTRCDAATIHAYLQTLD